MKKYLLYASVAVLLLACNKKQKPQPPRKINYVFSSVVDIPALPVTSGQGYSGTCWSFATTSFLESEIIRIKGEQIKLSEMYFVRSAYLAKAQNYILRQGTSRFTEGGLSHDPILSAAEYGLLPESGYTGLINGNTNHNHSKMFETLEKRVKQYAQPSNQLGAAWRTHVPAVLDTFMGKVPVDFQYEGKSYTPTSFLTYTQLHPEDYLTITSFSHVPFYKPFILSIPANWANGQFYNLPLDEFMANIDHALDAGFSLSLDLDGTEPTFFVEQGIGVLPENPADNDSIRYNVRPEKKVTQQLRQGAFETFATSDDHLMHIVGKAKDQYGNIYYTCKNSWGPTAGQHGFMYLSVAYMRMKAISVLLHKDGLIDSTRNKI
ncbi:C1 family peptidase [Chitinophaga sp.]|uniref:C1 family peptidase n=1 Tax=Chitinophaga sp. TaxID=1869181 RepID=UPI0031D8C3EC